MKTYEAAFNHTLPASTPTILRLDGHSFSRFTLPFSRPFDNRIHTAMLAVCTDLLTFFPQATVAYTQSDEITLVFPNGVQDIFNARVQKITSLAASRAGVIFYQSLEKALKEEPEPFLKFPSSKSKQETDSELDLENEYEYEKTTTQTQNEEKQEQANSLQLKDLPIPTFDARIHPLPTLSECLNNLLWRSRTDCTRNAITSFARTLFPASALHGKRAADVVSMLRTEKGVVFEDAVPRWAIEGCLVKWERVEHWGVNGKTGERERAWRSRIRVEERGVREFGEEGMRIVGERFW